MARLTKAEKQAKLDKDNLVKEMRKRYDDYTTAERHNIDAALLDLRVLVGEEHWDATTKKERSDDGRPCLVVNQLPVFTRQVIGDQRQARPATQIIPSDKAASIDNAEHIEGKIREIKYKSKADSAHDNAFGQSVRSSFGYWRIRTDYEDDDTFDQCIRIDSIPNQFGVKFDPMSTRWDKTDANWLIVETLISKDTFEDTYPGKDPSQTYLSTLAADWYTEEGVRVVEYFVKRPKSKTLWLMEMSSSVQGEEPLTFSTDNSDEKAQAEEQGFIVKKTRTVDAYEIVRYLMCGHDILEDEQVWPSKFWPVVEVLGEVVNVNGKPYKRSLIRDAHDSQRAYDYAISSEVETFSLAPKAPIVATPKQLANHESAWKQAHKRTYPFLYSNPDPAAPGWPQRIEPPQLSTAIAAFRAETKQTLRDTIGIFNAGLGENSQEISGIAIENRKRESDTGTYIWMDNLQYALELEDRIILDLLPKIYDNHRSTMTRSVDGTSKAIEINKPAVTKDGQQIIENDFTKGKYDVVVTMGPSFSTQRQEAKANMMELVKAAPQLMPFVVDKLVRSMDFQDAQDIAKRLVMGVVPKQVLSKEEIEALPPEATQEQPQQPDPLTLAQMQLAETQSKLNLAKAEQSLASANKSLAEIMQIKEEIQLQQSEMSFKVMQAVEAKIAGMLGGRQEERQQQPNQTVPQDGVGLSPMPEIPSMIEGNNA